MGIGGVLAILILLEFGKSARTDGLFAAYGAYAIVVALAQSFRGTIVARLMEGESLAANFDRFLGASAALFLALALPFLALGGPLADLLTGDLGPAAVDSARTALAILWVATGAQLCAALAAAALAVYDDYRAPALSYVAGGLLSLGLLLALAGPLGITAVPVALAAGGVTTASLNLWQLTRVGYRPSAARVVAGMRSRSSAKIMLAASAAPVAGQLTYLVSLAAAARLGEGTVTLYAYAFFASSILVGASAVPLGTVMAAAISEAWDRRPETLEPALVAVLRAGFFLIVPAVAIVAIVGRDIVELLIGSKVGSDDVTDVVAVFLGLSGVLVAIVGQTVPLLAAFAAGMYGRVALASLVSLLVQIGGAAVAVGIGTLLAIAIASSVTALVSLMLLTAVVYGRGMPGAMARVVRELGPVVLVAAVAFAPLGFAARDLGAPGHAAAALLGTALFVALSVRWLRAHWQLVVEALAPVRARRAA
jgi:peptidoglycan biosynthesis protein MviN/MurJ (putative lipid II flippase)